MKVIWQQITQTSETGTILDVPPAVAGFAIGLAITLAIVAYVNMRRHK